MSTLKFATRAKRVKNSAKVNELVEEKGLLRHYRSEIANLKMELAKALANEKTLSRYDKGMKPFSTPLTFLPSHLSHLFLLLSSYDHREVPNGESKQQEEKKKIEMDNEAMLKKMNELEQTRASLESKVSAPSPSPPPPPSPSSPVYLTLPYFSLSALLTYLTLHIYRH